MTTPVSDQVLKPFLPSRLLAWRVIIDIVVFWFSSVLFLPSFLWKILDWDPDNLDLNPNSYELVTLVKINSLILISKMGIMMPLWKN